MELTGDWEVGLAEIMFPRSWYTIPKDGLYIEVDYSRCSDKPISLENYLAKIRGRGDFYNCDKGSVQGSFIVPMYLNGGFYHTMEELVHELNNSGHRTFSASSEFAEESINPPTFYYRASAKRIFFTVPAGMSVKFPPSLESILGLSTQQNPLNNITKESMTVKADMACDLQAGIHALYVYCDLLQFTHVGDIKAPLLRVVDSGGETGDVITRYYERPRYVPLQKKNFDSIQLIIRDDLGEKIQFETGKVLLTLHFRRTRSQYLL
jgi:hypothetical protein